MKALDQSVHIRLCMTYGPQIKFDKLYTFSTSCRYWIYRSLVCWLYITAFTLNTTFLQGSYPLSPLSSALSPAWLTSPLQRANLCSPRNGTWAGWSSLEVWCRSLSVPIGLSTFPLSIDPICFSNFHHTSTLTKFSYQLSISCRFLNTLVFHQTCPDPLNCMLTVHWC